MGNGKSPWLLLASISKLQILYGTMVFLVGLRNNALFLGTRVFVGACGSVDTGQVFGADGNPARRTDFLDVKESEQRRNIGFIQVELFAPVLIVFHTNTIVFVDAVPQIADFVERLHILHFEHDKNYTFLPPSKPYSFFRLISLQSTMASS